MGSWNYGLLYLLLSCQLITVIQASKVWGEVPLPDDLVEQKDIQAASSLLDDDEDFIADEASGDLPSGEDDGSAPWPSVSDSTIYYRALVNFTDSIVYSPELEDIFSSAFNEISEAVVDTLESEYNRIPGVQTVSVVLIKKLVRQDGVDVFVELDVGSDYNSNSEQIRSVLYSVVQNGAIASYVTSVEGFQFRELGEVIPGIRPCMPDEHRCGDGTCILLEYLCDNRPDCRDMSDENDCDLRRPVATTPAPATTIAVVKPPQPPVVPGFCRADQAKCQSGECIPRDYICDGETDCLDGSDEFQCGTPSPCEPNEFKCKNGRCALKLWRCDGDNDCDDNSDELDCPTKGPDDRCAPEQFECLSDRTCIPASYQCDEEPDCPDRSDEYGCTPPSVTSPPEESFEVSRGATVTFTCQAVGVPTPIITWRLNWGHVPISGRISMTSENGHGTLTIRDVKEADQGAYTCEAINAKGLVFGIPDGVLTLTSNPNPGDCPDDNFSVGGRCVPCFCAGIVKNCKSTGRFRNQISLRFTEEDDFKGVNVSYPSRPGTPPLSSTQLLINPDMEEFQLVDLSRRFLNLDSFWTLPRQFLGNKIDSYGGSLKYKVRFILARGLSEPVEKPDIILVGNGRRLIYRRGGATPAGVVNQREIKFTEDNWQHSSGRQVSREELMMTLADLDSISIRTIYDNHMVSVALSDIVMDTTTVEFSTRGHAKEVEECRCPPGYTGLSCELCSSGFERVPGGSYLGTCAGCNCNGHASACDPISGHCLSCQHNTEGPQCGKCRLGYFGDARRGRADDCKPCPCPYYETSRRFSDTCFLDSDQQPTCDACKPGYTGRRCEKCAPGYQGNPLLPNGKCVPHQTKCDNRGSISSNSRPCSCKNYVAGAQCDECKAGFFHLTENNPEGCLRCFCMGVTKQCASSTWSRDQVRGGVNGQLFTLTNSGNTRTISEGISQRGPSEVVYRSFSSIPNDIYYWVVPESFRGDKVTAYGGELRYTVHFESLQRSLVIDGQPDVVLQGNGISLEHYSPTKPLPRVPQTVTVTFRESAWRRADGQPCTREHLLMALADVSALLIRATYADNMAESSISDIKMDIAVPHSTGNERALEVEECACPQGYRGPSCQECEEGYTRTGSGLYLGTCERCDCNGYASGCDPETGRCLQCQHNTDGPRCERCQTGYYGSPAAGAAQACQPCPCPGTASSNQFSSTCYLDSDGQPTCSCPPGYTGRRCEREEMPSADSCGDPFHEKLLDGNLPLGCGAEAIFNFSVDKEITPFGSGDTDHVDYHWPDTTAQTILSTRKVLSTPSHHRTTLSASTNGTGIVSVAPNKSATRLPPRFTPDPDSRRSSFQHLLRLHLNTFNQRLSMLESNTLDMRESIHRMEDQQINLSSQLKELIAVESAAEKTKRVTELEKSYNDMEARLSRLEGRLEILIDGFTALAQEMNKMKRTRHTSRSLQERMPLPSLSTVLVPPRYSTTHPPGKRITTKRPLTHRATVLQSIPTPSLLDSKPTTIPGKERKMLTVSAESLENTTTRVTSPSKHKVSNSKPKLKENVRNAAQPQSTTKPLATAKPEAKGRVSKSPIGSAKHVSQSNQTRLNQVQDKVAVTKFQLEPPSHRVTAQRHSAKSGRDKAFRSDEPLEKTVQRGRNVQNTNSVKVVTANIRLNTTKTTVPSLRARKKNLNTPATATSTPASSTATNANNSKKMKKQTRAPGTTKARTSKKSSTTTKSALHHKQTKSTTAVKSVKKPSSKAKTKARVATKKQQQNDKKHTRSGILDLLKLLKGGHKKHADGSLHVVLGRLAIPIRIIPDD